MLSKLLFVCLRFHCISHAAIDGDGMVVAVTFDQGRVHLRARYVATKERLEEQSKRKFLYRGQMGTHPNSPLKDTAILLKNFLTLKWPKLQYRNPSNTNVFYWGGKVFVWEGKERERGVWWEGERGREGSGVRLHYFAILIYEVIQRNK